MTRRHRTIVAVAVTAAVLITVGLGAYTGDGNDDPDEDVCETNLAKVFEWSDRDSEGLAEEYREAATAGGVMFSCPEQVSCTELDPIWCAPCEDMHGAPFWFHEQVATVRCSAKFGWDLTHVDKVAYAACLIEKTEQECPALEGTDWYARARAAVLDETKRLPDMSRRP
jgi:hypothetical protein